MELTSKEKAKVFAMYLGCKIQVEFKTTDGDTGQDVVVKKEKVLEGVSLEGLTFEGCIIAANPKLILRTIEQLTDEGAVEVIKIYTRKTFTVVSRKFGSIYLSDKDGRIISLEKDLSFGYEDDLYESDYFKKDIVFQYLISKGYAVALFFSPGHPANGRTAMELGLAINTV